MIYSELCWSYWPQNEKKRANQQTQRHTVRLWDPDPTSRRQHNTTHVGVITGGKTQRQTCTHTHTHTHLHTHTHSGECQLFVTHTLSDLLVLFNHQFVLKCEIIRKQLLTYNTSQPVFTLIRPPDRLILNHTATPSFSSLVTSRQWSIWWTRRNGDTVGKECEFENHRQMRPHSLSLSDVIYYIVYWTPPLACDPDRPHRTIPVLKPEHETHWSAPENFQSFLERDQRSRLTVERGHSVALPSQM